MISANQISAWAATAEAQRDLPRLVRRLAYLNGTTTSLAIPSGESTSQPGWDGEVHSTDGDAWVPAGHSCWEVSCETPPTAKANRDYEKRTRGHTPEYRSERTFIFVTPRKWPQKAKWIAQRRKETSWKDVRAYDADDIEQWLEQASAVALAFGEELGLTGPGVESLALYLNKWLTQTSPPLAATTLLTGRSEQADRLSERLTKAASAPTPSPISFKADSVDEATAFVAAAIMEDPKLADKAVVVTQADGWRFLEKNQELQIAVAAAPEIAESPPSRAGLVVIIPYASGDMASHFKGVAGRLDDDEQHLERPDHSEFEEALQQLGIEENDARRLSGLCGRSWSVFRRQHAVNPAIRKPAWLEHPASAALSALCLLGAWSGGKAADKELVEKVSGLSYDALEAQLAELERLDDAPILHIGDVWKAKSALELLALFGDRITDDAMVRFFRECEALLSAPDPQLELPVEERYAAAVHGKVRPVSGLLLNAVCDTLIKLAVRGPDIPVLAAKHIQFKVDRLIRNLFMGADEIRWLSLSDHLPALAEASPTEFLAAIESSLDSPNAPIRRLLSESRSSGFGGGGCWHAGLLWALETLAWAPQRLTRVSVILARLSETKIEGNWGNSPMNSLMDLYRSWFPQTAATIEQRIQALDALIARAPDASYKLLDRLAGAGHDMASPTSRPKWRDDDAGVGRGVSRHERHQMVMAALERQIAMADGNAERVAALLDKITNFDAELSERVLSLLPGVVGADDSDKELMRSELRGKLHWHRNYDDRDPAELDAFLLPLEQAYEQLTPSDLIERHKWLFSDGWPQLPVRTKEEDLQGKSDHVTNAKLEAAREIFEACGWDGLTRLAMEAGSGWRVGHSVVGLGLPLEELADWIVTQTADLLPEDQTTSMAGGILGGLQGADRETALDLVLAKAEARSIAWKIRLLVLNMEGRPVWNRAASLGEEAERLYWQSCYANFWIDDEAELSFAMRKLLAVSRPVSALNACHRGFAKLGPQLVAEILEAINAGNAADVNRIDAYSIQEAVKYLEGSGQLDPGRLARIEFSLFPAFQYEAEGQAVALYRALTTEPSVFMELLSLAYRAEGEPERNPNEAEKSAMRVAWRVLDNCKRQPGASDDGSVDPIAFASFVADVRKMAKEAGRIDPCDIVLGHIFAHSPEGEDGVWPFVPARDALEQIGTEAILDCFRTGCFNKRGVTTRGVFDGGGQERDLAAHYRRHATALQITHPRVAETLERLARSYDYDGMDEDIEVQLRRERF